MARKTVQLTGSFSAEFLREVGSYRMLCETDDKYRERIVRLFGVGENDDLAELYLEYMAGGNLKDFLKINLRRMKDLQRHFSEQLLQGVCFIHSHDLVHRDLKPANILLTEDTVPQLKIADFGMAQIIARRTPRSPLARDIPSHAYVELMMLQVCTLYYRAPEVLADGIYDKSMDNWSVGCIIMQMLTRGGPFFAPPKPIHTCPIKSGKQQAAAILRQVARIYG